MVKDRLLQFRDIYEQNVREKTDDDVDDLFLSWQESLQSQKLTYKTEDFLKKVTNIHQRLNLSKELINELQAKQSEILTATSTDAVLNEERDQIIATIKEMTSYIHQDIKLLEKEAELDNFDKTAEDKIKRDQVNILFILFQDVMVEYNNTQMLHRDRCKSRIERQLQIAGTSKTSEEIEVMIETGNTNVFHQELLTETDKARDALRDVEDRHNDILKLEKSLAVRSTKQECSNANNWTVTIVTIVLAFKRIKELELFEIFQEVACMIDIQGDLIDNIERNVRDTVDSVHASKVQMKMALKYKRRKLLTLCCPCLSLYRSCSIL